MIIIGSRAELIATRINRAFHAVEDEVVVVVVVVEQRQQEESLRAGSRQACRSRLYALGHVHVYDEITAVRYRDGLLLEESVA